VIVPIGERALSLTFPFIDNFAFLGGFPHYGAGLRFVA